MLLGDLCTKTYQFTRRRSAKDDNYEIMSPVKPQLSKFKAEKSCQVGFIVF